MPGYPLRRMPAGTKVGCASKWTVSWFAHLPASFNVHPYQQQVRMTLSESPPVDEDDFCRNSQEVLAASPTRSFITLEDRVSRGTN